MTTFQNYFEYQIYNLTRSGCIYETENNMKENMELFNDSNGQYVPLGSPNMMILGFLAMKDKF